jgi:1,4-dihydroxy-2-naphthoate octaprenyltransferase
VALLTWVEAARVRTLSAAIVPVLIGSAAAFYDGRFRWTAALLALVGALAVQVAANFANDVSDATRGADHAGRIGPTRMVATGRVSRRAMWTATWLMIFVAAACGILLAMRVGLIVLWIGLASVVAMLGYVGGPRPYGYRGLGELSVFLFFGIVATWGSRLVHDGSSPAWVVALGVPVGMLAAAILVANNLRDIPSDAAAGKRTLAVMLGPDRTRTLFIGLTLGAPVLLVLLAGLRVVPWPTVVGLLIALLLPRLVGLARRAREPGGFISLLVGTARVHLLFGILVAAGLVIARGGT